ncbi:MAG: FAD-dependent oxidoreductase [bacterium]|nr:FAD-dependent oxidoreductase [bacterium]
MSRGNGNGNGAPQNGDARVGVYVCHCGVNISSTVDVEAVRDVCASRPGVVCSRDYKFMCSNAGQDLIKKDILENGVNRVVVAACSPLMHELTFRAAAEEAGLNPYLVQIANIREQCAWVHDDRERATAKASSLASGAAARVALHRPLEAMKADVNPATLIVGAGIAGIQAALEIAEAGHDVYLVEKQSTIGGQMAKFDKTFPTLDCAACILTPKMVSISHRKNIHLMTLSEVESVDGFVGNFKVAVRRKARYVTDACTACGECLKVCPVRVPSPFEELQADRTAIHKEFPQAIPSTFVIEKQGRPPCRQACPVHQDAAGYVSLVAEGRFAEAAKLIRRQNPLPSICGRVCYAACEEACNRQSVDKPVAIRDLKRFVIDWERKHVGEVEPPPPENRHPESVAVIGSGPAGLTCAFDLARKGYTVTVFEKHKKLGGMLAVGLPGYRCPREEVERDLAYIRKTGVEFRSGMELGVDFAMEDLLSDRPGFGFDAVFLGIGAHRGLKMGIEGEDVALEARKRGAFGVITGVDYLRHLNLGLPQETGKKVAIVGGGNTALDAARAARREGAEVTVLYRRTREEMPCEEDEFDDAVAEGVRFEYLVLPIKVLGEDGSVNGLECLKMELGEPDASGRPRPVPITGSEHVKEFDQVIPAISQRPIWRWLKNWSTQAEADPSGHLSFTPWETLKVDPDSMRSGHPKIFGGGDVVLGPSTIVESMGQGRRAAEAIDKQLRALPLEDFHTYVPPRDPREGFEERPHSYAPRYDETPLAPRTPMPKRPPEIRVGDYQPVDLGYSEEQARAEASRCLKCGVCVECYECERVCEPGAVLHEMTDTVKEIEVGQILVSTGYQTFDARKMMQYGYGLYDNVLTSLEFERMVSSTGPTGGKVLCKNGLPPRAVGIVHCVGSRDENHHPYCSRVCCMYALKFAHLVNDRTDADVYQFYIDMRTFGKGYEEFYRHVLEEGTTVIRGKVAEVVPARGSNGGLGEHLLIRCEDTMIGRFREIPVDMVVLCNALEAREDASEVRRTFSLSRSPDGFFMERHPKLDPVGTTTDGVYLAGCCQGPKDIPDTVAQAQAAAARVLGMIAKGQTLIDPVRAEVDAKYCSGCKTCLDLCPYAAISFDGEANVAAVNEALCKGCGTCVAACPASAITGAGFTDAQVLAELEGILAPPPETTTAATEMR